MKLRITLFVLTGLALMGSWYFLLIVPANQAHARIQSELASTRVQLEDYQSTLNQLPVFLQTRDGISNKIAKINARLYSRQEILNLFDYVEQMAESQSLYVNELAPHIEELLRLAQAPHVPGQPQTMSVSLRVTGDFLTFGHFITMLEKQAFFKQVDRCLISDSPDTPGQLLFDLEFKALLETSWEHS